ncbi:hypothetical protein KEM54_006875 [Ascosphaera aggregata]|nr:hypothetical protein KEM54_006875 [Ascosphaera aggregata]
MYSSKGVGEAAFAATPESSSSAPLPLDEEDLRTQFHRFIAKTLVKVPPAVAQRFIDYFRNDTTVSMSPRDLSAIALESAAAANFIPGLSHIPCPCNGVLLRLPLPPYSNSADPGKGRETRAASGRSMITSSVSWV